MVFWAAVAVSTVLAWISVEAQEGVDYWVRARRH
jgi:hypothetical protein